MRKFTPFCFKLVLLTFFLLLVQASGWAQVLDYPADDGPGNPYTANGITRVAGTHGGGLKSAALITSTPITTTDNENNNLTGLSDDDMDNWLYNTDPNSPIEFNIFVDDVSVTTAQLSLLVYDIDYTRGERDEVYFNGHYVGTLSGTNNSWSTNSWTIDPSWVNTGPAGKNLVRILIDVDNQGDWAVTVDWGQLNINGATSGLLLSSATLNKACFAACDPVTITMEVDANPSRSVIVETVLVNPAHNTIDQEDKTITATTGDEHFSITLDAIACDALLGQEYEVRIFVYEDLLGAKGIQLAYKGLNVPVCGCGIVDIKPDVAWICAGTSQQLTATGAATYVWSPATGLSATNIANPVASPIVTTTYTVTGTVQSGELLTNAGFESGNTGFTSGYSYVADNPLVTDELVPEGTYAVGGDAANYHDNFAGTPHSGSGMMMIVNGSEVADKTVWSETISILPNTDYIFSAWAYRLADETSNATLQLVINGVNVGAAFTVSAAAWTQFTRPWNSGTATSPADVKIIDTNTDAGDNDFAMDDLSFTYHCVNTDQVTISVDNDAPVITCPVAPAAQCSITEVPPVLTLADFIAAGGSVDDGTGFGIDNKSFKWVGDVSDMKECPETVTRTYSIADQCGHISTCQQTIIVDDTILPVMVLHDMCVFLTNEGKWTLNDEEKLAITKDITDNCTVFKDLIITIDPVSFDCNDIIKQNPVVVTARDRCGNLASGTAYVTVADTISPVAKCHDVTTYLDAFGQSLVVPGQVNQGDDRESVPAWAKYFNNLEGGSYDNCGIKEMYLSKHIFTCADVAAPVEVTLKAIDPSGNFGTCKAFVTVKDTLAPVFTPPGNLTLTVDPGVCVTKVTYPEIVVKDNCTVMLEKISGLGKDGLFPLGTTVETWKATDIGGKSATMSFNVTISTFNSAPAIASVADIIVDEDAPGFDVPLSGIGYGIDCIAQQISSLDVTNSNTDLLEVTKEYTLGETTGKLVVTPLANKNGVATITLTLMDDGGTANNGVNTTVKTFIITVNAVNDAPTATPIADQMVILPNSLSVNVVTPFSDVDEADELSFTVTKSDGSPLPPWMTFSTSTGLLTGTPATADLGWTEIKVVATDKAEATAEEVFLVVVTDPNGSTLGVTAVKGTTPLTDGFGVSLFVKDGNFYKAVVNTPLFVAGTYMFYNLPDGTYLAKAVITDATVNPGLLHTYYESSTSVTGASQIVFSSAATKFIQVKMQPSTLATGVCKISGIVIYKTGTPDLIPQGSDPVSTPAAGVDLVLKQNGVIVANTQTGADGKYAFNNLPEGTYDVFVEVTGYTQNVTQKVTLDTANPVKDKVNFTIWTGDNSFVITTIKDLNNDFGFRLFPNPTFGKANIEITWNGIRKVDVMVYNILGVQVFRNQYTSSGLITIDLSDQVAGIYFVQLNAEGHSFVRKLTLEKR